VIQERVYVVEVVDRLAGFLAIEDEGGGRGYLHGIFVGPEHQGRGVGSVLMRLAKELAPGGLRLHTSRRNALAAAFYERPAAIK
jgi:ribosomal protein S18 acetylase RimI-like enzyme